MELSTEEKEFIKHAYTEVANLAGYEKISVNIASQQRHALKKFLAAWDGLSLEEKSIVSFELARLASPRDESEDTENIELSVCPSDLDVGLATFNAIKYGNKKPGVGVRAPGFKEAVLAAIEIWEARGNDKEIGNIHRSSAPYQTYPMLKFVVGALSNSLSDDIFKKATLGNPPSEQEILTAVDTQIRTHSKK
jgi:hypothetical protein